MFAEQTTVVGVALGRSVVVGVVSADVGGASGFLVPLK